MTTKTVDIILSLKPGGSGAKQIVTDLKAVEAQANRTREKMQKLADVGNKLALAGGLIVAPFAIAMKKYVDSAKETEPISKRLVALNKKWEESQVRLGRVTAEIVLPALEKGAAMLERVIQFAEKNPGVVQAALTIGTTLVVLGGLISTTAQLVATVASIQGLAASAGIALGGGGAAAGAAGGALAGGGMAAAVTAGITAAVPFVIPTLVAAIGIAVVAPLTLGFFNALAGTNETMADLLDTAAKLPTVIGYLLGNLGRSIFSGLESMGRDIYAGFIQSLKNIIDLLPSTYPGKAAGGYAQKGIYQLGEGVGRLRGPEFVMNAETTRNAERAIGGGLTQASAASYMTNNIKLSNGMTISQQKRMMKKSENAAFNRMMSVIG
jgi:hypothetical protein